MTYWMYVDYATRTATIHTSDCSLVNPRDKSPGTGLWQNFRTISGTREAAMVTSGGRVELKMCGWCRPEAT